MCGLLGVLDRGRLAAGVSWSPDLVVTFDHARDRLSHRGPDGAGTWHAPGVILGHRRLSILDLSDSAAQPMVSSAGTVLVFNGEIYNYVELRAELAAAGATFRSTGDTEVLLSALDRWGLDRTLQRLRGMFAFAAWRPGERELWLARDPVGKKPLFVACRNDHLVFGSSVEAVLQCLARRGFRPELDPVAIQHALAIGYSPAPRTGISGLRKLPAGSRMVVPATGEWPDPVRYWQVPFPRERTRLTDSWEQVHGLFRQAVARRLRSDVPVAAFLSGGLDSSLVVAAASREKPDLVAYTARTGNRNDDEFDLAVRIAKHLGVRHRVIDMSPDLLGGLDGLVRQYGEAWCDSSALPTAAICRAAGSEYRVMLTGDGGDEVQGGYPTAAFFALRALLWGGDRLGRSPGRIRRGLAGALGNDVRRLEGGLPAWRFRLLRLMAPPEEALLLRHDGLDQSRRLLQAAADKQVGGAGWCSWAGDRVSSLGAGTGIDAQLGMDFSVYLADDLNVKVDVASMAASVETRSPLLDLDFVEACWNLRTFDRVRPWARKRVVRRLAGAYLPADLLIRRKQGFSIPVSRWLADSGAGRQVMADLAAGRTGLEEVLDGAAATRVIAGNRARGREPAELCWRLLVLSRWARWVKGNHAGSPA